MRQMRGAGAVVSVAAIALACGGAEKKAPAPPDAKQGVTAGATTAASTTPTPSGRRTVLFLGTSLTAGLGLEPDSAYPQQIQRKIDERKLSYETVNAGVSGETSAGLLRRLDWVLQSPAAVIVVETGANDGLRGQSVEATKATIGKVLDRIKHDRPEARVLLVQMEAPTNLGKVYTSAFHGMFPALAAEHDVGLLPFLLDGVAGRASLNQGDGVHPNYVGERIVTANVWKALEPVLSGKG